MAYGSLEQLVAARYIDIMALPPDDKSGCAGLHDAVKHVYEAVVVDPGLLFKSLHTEDIYRNRFNMSSENKPELYGLMKRIFGAFDGFFISFREMLRIADPDGENLLVPKALKLKKSHLKLLEAIGMPCSAGKTEYTVAVCGYADELESWKRIANDDAISDFMFARGAYGKQAEYVHDVFRRGLGNDGAFDKLIAYLRGKGFEMGIMRGDELILDYSIDYGKKPSPLKAGWAEREHSGIECKYYPVIKNAFAITLRIPKITELLGMFDSMPDAVKAFVVSVNKKCDNCRYCVQTDKFGTRPLAFVAVTYEGNKYALCPRFPGFAFTWDALEDHTVDSMIAYLEFIDGAFGK